MSRKKKTEVKFTKAVEDLIIENIQNGVPLARLCRENPNTIPERSVVYYHADRDESFQKRLDDAYAIYVFGLIDELERISTAPIAELYPELDFKSACEARRTRIDVLKFTAAKLAPVLSKRFDRAQKIDVSGEITLPTINVLTFSESNKIKDITPKPRQIINDTDSD